MLRKLFGGKRYWAAMLNLALPIAIQNLLISSFVLVDTLMVSSLGDISLAAVGMAGQWSWLLNLALFGFASGASVFFSQYYGDENLEDIKKTYGIVMTFVCCAAVLFALFGGLMPKQIISIFNRDAQVLDVGIRYLRIAVFSYPAIVINHIIGVLLRSTGRAKLPMFVAAFTTVLNAFMDYALIFGKFGFPNLGVEGAAIATCISAWAGPVIIFAIMFYRKDEIVCAPLSELLNFKKEDVKIFFSRALPVLINEVLWGLGTFALNVVYSNLGYENYAAITILKTFDNIIFAFYVGINNSCCIMVGQEIGGGHIKKGLTDAKRFTLVVPIFGIIISTLTIVFKNDLINIFNTAGTITEHTLAIARSIIVVYAVVSPLRSLLYVIITGIFRSGGDTATGMKYDLLCLWGISVPMSIISAYIFKLPFVLVYTFSMVFEDLLKIFLCLRHLFSKRWVMPITETGRLAYEKYKKELRSQ